MMWKWQSVPPGGMRRSGAEVTSREGRQGRVMGTASDPQSSSDRISIPAWHVAGLCGYVSAALRGDIADIAESSHLGAIMYTSLCTDRPLTLPSPKAMGPSLSRKERADSAHYASHCLYRAADGPRIPSVNGSARRLTAAENEGARREFCRLLRHDGAARSEE